jgi:predicted DNA-binding protein (MmcQ/YjbR family)
MPTPRGLERAEQALRKVALAYPGAYEEFPWGHRAMKVKGKAFVFMANEDEELSLSVKLPVSSAGALMLPFAEPTGYGLGKSGWVTARFGPRDDVPVPILRTWIDESYRSIAPRKLLDQLPGTASGPTDTAAGAARRPRRVARRAKPRGRTRRGGSVARRKEEDLGRG